MATNGKFVLFWMPEEDYVAQPGDEAGATWTEDRIDSKYKIEVEATSPADAPDSLTGLVSIKPMISRTRTVNPAPFSDEAKRPDTGFSGIRLECRLFFGETQSVTANPAGPTKRAKAIDRLCLLYTSPSPRD